MSLGTLLLMLGAAAQNPAPDAPDALVSSPMAEVADEAESETSDAAGTDPDDAQREMDDADVETADVEAVDVEAVDVEAVDVEAVDVEDADVEEAEPRGAMGDATDNKDTDDNAAHVDPAAPVMIELAGAFSMTSAGPATFALSDMLHVNRILHLWPEFRGGARWPLGNFGVGGEVQVGHTSVAQGNSIVGERLYLFRGAAVGIVDYRIDLHRRSVLDGVRLGFTGRLDVQGGVRALVAVQERRFGPVLNASLAAGPRVVIEWPWVNFVFDTFLGWGTGGPVSGAGLGLAFDFSI